MFCRGDLAEEFGHGGGDDGAAVVLPIATGKDSHFPVRLGGGDHGPANAFFDGVLFGEELGPLVFLERGHDLLK